MYVSIRAVRHNIKGDVALTRCLFALTLIYIYYGKIPAYKIKR